MSKKGKDDVAILTRVDKTDHYENDELPSFVASLETDGLIYSVKGNKLRSQWRLATDLHELGETREGEKGTITLKEIYKYGFYPEDRALMWEVCYLMIHINSAYICNICTCI